MATSSTANSTDMGSLNPTTASSEKSRKYILAALQMVEETVKGLCISKTQSTPVHGRMGNDTGRDSSLKMGRK
jgi:hypothetical protein